MNLLFLYFAVGCHVNLIIQRINGTVNAHLISGSSVSTKSKFGQNEIARVFIYINFVELELHAKCQDRTTFGY